MCTVNKAIFKRRWVNFTSFFCLLIVLFSFPVHGQKISNYYVSSIQGNDNLYFIKPQGGWENKTHNSSLEYDITYLSSNDSAVLNFSYFDPENLDIRNLVLKTGNDSVVGITKTIFIDSAKSKWKYRLTTTFLLTDLKKFFSDSGQPVFIIISGEKQIVQLTIRRKIWVNQRQIVSRILEMISLNRK